MENIELLCEIPERHKCIYCGGEIIYDDTRLYKNSKNNIIIKGKSFQTKKVIDGKDFPLLVCQKCLQNKFPDIKLPIKSFCTMCESTKYAFNISDDVYFEFRKRYAMTKDKMIAKYGEEEGLTRWENYCKRQSETNTYKYKKEKYGWTESQFKEYNNKRAVTKINIINRYGEEEGLKRWENYCKRQSETKSKDWMVKHYGVEKTNNINSKKALTLKNFISKYGEEGFKRWEEYQITRSNSYSKISQRLFDDIDQYLGNKYTTYYATKGDGEWFVNCGDHVYFLDYYIKELNICIEFNGDAWHGNPNKFNKTDKCHPIYKDITAEDLQLKDECRLNELKQRNINTYIIWESDYNPKNFNIKQYINDVLKIEI